jgi:uncharacterized membrane protein YedE/YeeE
VTRRWPRWQLALPAGVLFGAGLAISGMTRPDKVLNFLDFTGRWDPSLALVMAGAVAVSLPGFARIRRREMTVCGDPLQLPANGRVDARLLGGSALFGIGWGIAGYCPGPAVANLAHGGIEAIVFMLALLAGSWLARLVAPR